MDHQLGFQPTAKIYLDGSTPGGFFVDSAVKNSYHTVRRSRSTKTSFYETIFAIIQDMKENNT